MQGVNIQLQIGRETTYGSAPGSATMAIPVTSWQVSPVFNKLVSKALLGQRAAFNESSGDYDIRGSFTFEADPTTFGCLLWLICGAEAAPVSKGSGVYQHVFTPVQGAGNKLPSFFATFYDGVSINPATGLVAPQTFYGCKVDSMSIAVDSTNYMTVTVNIKGQRYDFLNGLNAALSLPVLRPFTFKNTSLYFGGSGQIGSAFVGSAMIEAGTFVPTYNNNVEDVRQRMDGYPYGQEPDYQLLEFTFDAEVDLDTLTAQQRGSAFLQDIDIGVMATFTHDSAIPGGSGSSYMLSIYVPYADCMNAPENVTGPDRIKFTFAFKAIQQFLTTAPVQIQMQDARSSAYSTF